ncbi:TPA: hypothetical protein ACHK5P_004008, partial [Escherichia coli]
VFSPHLRGQFFTAKRRGLSRLVRKTYRSNQRRARRMTVWCFLIAENGDLKENKIFFCVDNSVFSWVLILWYELKKKNTTRG